MFAQSVVRALTSGQPNTHGSARFRDRREMCELESGDGLVVGRLPRGKAGLLRYDGEGHLLTVAPTRAGKGVGSIIPNLLLADRPVIAIDPKGENFKAASAAREKYGPVFALDPFGVVGSGAVAYNPMDFLDPGSAMFAEDAYSLATALVSDAPSQVREAHWNEEATALIHGLIMFCATTEAPEHRNLGRVRAYLTMPPEGFKELLELMQQSTAADGLVARAANRRLGQNDREAASILTTAQRHTHFLDSAMIQRVTARTDFSFMDVANHSGSVFLVLPPDRIATYSRWLRVMVGQAITEIARAKEPPARRVLFMLDECAALGRLEPLQQAAGLMAGYGMQIWSVFQDLHQLREVYGKSAETFLANAGVVQAFNVNDLETARWVSHSLGANTVTYATGRASDRSGQARTGRPLLTPEEVLNLPPDQQILLTQTGRPVAARKVQYFRDAEFRGFLGRENQPQR